MCRPARMIRGRSSRSSTQRVSTGKPASRSSSAPASRSASACSSVVASSTAAVRVEADVAVRVDQAGQHPAAVEHRVGALRPGRCGRDPARRRPTTSRVLTLGGRTTPRRCRALTTVPWPARVSSTSRAGSRPLSSSGSSKSSGRSGSAGHRLAGLRGPRHCLLLERALGRVAGPAALGLAFGAACLALRLLADPHARHARHARACRPAAAGHLLHHLLRLGEPLDQPVDVGDGACRSRGRCAAGASR